MVAFAPHVLPDGEPSGLESSSSTAASRGRKIARRTVVASVGSLSMLLLSACSVGGKQETPAQKPSPTPTTAPTAQITPATVTENVNPVTVPSVVLSHGSIESLSLKNAAGKEVSGQFSQDRKSWKATSRLEFAQTYTLTYKPRGFAAVTKTFTTTNEQMQMDAFAYPPKGSTVGVGQPIQITFSEPVKNKLAVQKAITITSTSGQKGRFYWLTDTVVRYRPEKYWAAHSKITIDFKMFGVDVGNGMIGNFDAVHEFSTHNVRHAVVSDKDLIFNVFIDGKKVRSWPTTLGNERWPSADGIFPIMEQERKTFFNPRSIGLKPGDKDWYEPFYYYWTSRLTSSGVYVHQVGDSGLKDLGLKRISHGCISLAEEGARYIYDNFGPGDIIEVRDTGNGYASLDKGYMDWNIPWSEYGV